MLTHREIWDKVWKYYVTDGNPLGFHFNGKRSPTPALRGAGESRCPIGLFIPDDKFKPEMEGWPLLILLDRRHVPELYDGTDADNFLGTARYNFLKFLQIAHDKSGNNLDSFKSYMRIMEPPKRARL